MRVRPSPTKKIVRRLKGDERHRMLILILVRDGNRCWLCDRPLDRMALTLEHLHPTSKGGTNESSNQVIVHPKCNRMLDDRPKFEKLEIREALRAK